MSQGFTKGTPIDTDPTLSLNSDIVVPSQKAVKSYLAANYQPTLVSATNIKTVNGNSLLGSGDLVIGGGITVGTTPIASGTVGRILFENGGNVLGQDSALFWDNTNKRLGIGATPDTSTRLDVRAQGALSTDIAFRVRNSANTYNIISTRGDGIIDIRNSAGSVCIGGAGTAAAAAVIVSYPGGTSTAGLRSVAVGGDNNAGSDGVAVGYNVKVQSAGNGGVGVGQNISGGAGLSFGKTIANTLCTAIGNNLTIGGSGATNNNVIAIGNGMTETSGNAKLPHTFMFGSYATTGNKAGLSFRSNNLNHLLLGYDIMSASYSNTIGTNWIGIANGTAPSGSIDASQLYSADITAGNAAPHFRTENGSIIKLFQGAALTASDGTLANAVTRIAEIQARLQAHGLIA